MLGLTLGLELFEGVQTENDLLLNLGRHFFFSFKVIFSKL